MTRDLLSYLTVLLGVVVIASGFAIVWGYGYGLIVLGSGLVTIGILADYDSLMKSKAVEVRNG